MSRHLTNCAADVQIEPLRLKLALLCFAESARDRDHIALPGYAALMKWTHVKKSQVHNLINALLELQLIARHKPAHRGQRAEYLVFPNGCCEVHGKRPAAVVDDGADVVSIGLDDTPGEPFRGVNMTFSTGSDDDAQSLDPLPRERVQSAERKGPIDSGNGSNIDPGKGPVTTLRSERLQEHPPVVTSPQNHSTTVAVCTDLTDARASTPGQQPIEASSKPAALRADGPATCPHCDRGYLHDLDGLPAGICLRCAAGRRAARETA